MTPTPTFTTPRLAVFRQDVVISETLCAPRALFVAFPREADCPRVVCTMLVSLAGFFPAYVDWVATDPDFRRQGFAAELWRGVAAYLGPLSAEGVSEAGEALVAKMERENLA